MTTTTGALGNSVKPLHGVSKMAKKAKGGKAPKAAKQPKGAGAGVAQTQSKALRLDSLKMPGKK